jgi:hypothetical protein
MNVDIYLDPRVNYLVRQVTYSFLDLN